MMKGGNYCSVKGKQLFLTLLVLILTTIYLLTWERTPFYTSLLLAKDRYTVPSPDLLLDAQNSSSSSLKSEKQNEEYSFSSVTKETKTPEFSGAPMNSASMSSPKSNSAPAKAIKSSPESKGGTPMNLVTASSSENTSVAPAHSASTSSPESKGGVPMNLTSTSTPKSKGLAVNITSSSKTKVCNYAKGRWIADSKRPLYSGFACKQWLSEMWACRMTQRKDFSYEGYRWQPENCAMPEFEESAFLRKMQDKTIAFIGDSLGRQQFQSLMCMATGGEYNMVVQDVGKEYGLVKARGAIRPDGWAYRFPTTNTTILYYWSASLSDLVPLNSSDKASDIAMHLDRPPAFMRQYLPRFDVLVLNTGHHWNRGKLKANRWVMHINGKPNEDTSPDAIVNAKNLTVYSVVRWLDSQLPSHPGLKAFFRTISPRHFKSGDWNSGGNCDNTIPLSGGSEVLEDGSSDPLVEGAVRGTKVKILDITAISQLRDEGHISRYSYKGIQNSSDCLHWCLPGVPDTWNELLIAQI